MLWFDPIGNLAAQAAQAAKEPPLPETEMIPEDVIQHYAEMVIPETIPIPGWSLIIREGGAFRRDSRGCLELTDEATEWCDINLTHRYWVLGDAVTSTMGARTYELFFETENDYIFFKMRWG